LSYNPFAMTDRPKGRRPSGAGPQPPHFPPGRAFVVQFSAAEESEKPTSGRVEHVLSGRGSRFESLEKLSEFIGEVLARERGRGEGSEEE
jgi:hypothetical protein